MGNVISAELADEIIQPWWTAWMAQRWGFGDHCCHLWAATGLLLPQTWRKFFGGQAAGPIETVIIYRELLVQGLAEAELANRIVEMTPPAERPHISRCYLGSEALSDKKHGENNVRQLISAVLRKNGLPDAWDADENRIEGWRFMYACLRQAQMQEMEFIPAERIREGPMLLVSSDCPQCIEGIPKAVRDEQHDKPEDVIVLRDDWVAVTDAVRYLLKSKPAPRAEAPVGVRRQDLCRSVPDITARNMALMQFNETERKRNKSGRPAWRAFGEKNV